MLKELQHNVIGERSGHLCRDLDTRPKNPNDIQPRAHQAST